MCVAKPLPASGEDALHQYESRLPSICGFRKEKFDLLAKTSYNTPISNQTSAVARPVLWAGRFVYFIACAGQVAETLLVSRRIFKWLRHERTLTWQNDAFS